MHNGPGNRRNLCGVCDPDKIGKNFDFWISKLFALSCSLWYMFDTFTDSPSPLLELISNITKHKPDKYKEYNY